MFYLLSMCLPFTDLVKTSGYRTQLFWRVCRFVHQKEGVTDKNVVLEQVWKDFSTKLLEVRYRILSVYLHVHLLNYM